METDTTKPSIYVACLAAYNNGILHGAWIDADTDASSIHEDIARMLRASPIASAEEWTIHDYEGFESVHISEYADIDDVAESAALISEHGKLGAALIAHFSSVEEARSALNDHYHGSFASLADYVQDLTEDCTAIPEILRHYIDWQAMALDAEMSGDVFTIQLTHDEVHVFSGC